MYQTARSQRFYWGSKARDKQKVNRAKSRKRPLAELRVKPKDKNRAYALIGILNYKLGLISKWQAKTYRPFE